MRNVTKRNEEFVREENRAWLVTRLVIAYGLLEWALWTAGTTQKIASVCFLAWVIVTTLMQRRKPRELGLGLDGMLGASIALVVAISAAVLILTCAWTFGTLRTLYGSRPLAHALGYTFWATIQEFILNSYFFLSLEELFGRSLPAAGGAVLLFTAAHFPNPVLMVGTCVLACFLVLVFRRFRNIYPLGLAHAILGLSVALAVPDPLLRHMRVGLGYYHFILK